MSAESKSGWSAVWKRKGQSKTNDLMEISGWDGCDINLRDIAAKMLKVNNYQKGESILEVGAGPGALAEHFNGIQYLAVEKYEELVAKHNEICGKIRCVQGELNSLPVGDKTWDHVIVNSVFQYIHNEEYADQAMKELERAAKKTVVISDIRRQGREKKKKSHDKYTEQKLEHFTFTTDYFESRGYEIIDTFFDLGYGEPFSALKKLNVNDKQKVFPPKQQ